jgi:hypothetical protein
LRSKALVSAGYDEQALELELEFRSGHVYRYERVPRSVYEWLLRVENKGGFVRRMIQGCYVERGLPRPGPSAPGEAAAPGAPGLDALESALRASLERLDKPGA